MIPKKEKIKQIVRHLDSISRAMRLRRGGGKEVVFLNL